MCWLWFWKAVAKLADELGPCLLVSRYITPGLEPPFLSSVTILRTQLNVWVVQCVLSTLGLWKSHISWQVRCLTLFSSQLPRWLSFCRPHVISPSRAHLTSGSKYWGEFLGRFLDHFLWMTFFYVVLHPTLSIYLNSLLFLVLLRYYLNILQNTDRIIKANLQYKYIILIKKIIKDIRKIIHW